MMFVFAALGEFVVVKVLDKQYQMNKNKAQDSLPRIIPVVSTRLFSRFSVFLKPCPIYDEIGDQNEVAQIIPTYLTAP